MAQHGEPMDVDCMDNDFDNKENTFQHSNVLPCTEKGYEELDVSELNMKLRYSMTPASSPMSKSFTTSLDNRNVDTDNVFNHSNENSSLTQSLNSAVNKSIKSLPLQSLPTDQFIDGNGNASVLRPFDLTITNDDNVTVKVYETNDINENLSVPSSSSSALQTPEATTPTKEIAKDGGSPIIRGLKSVLNMFRPSQSPILTAEDDFVKHETNPSDVSVIKNAQPKAVASTPIAAHRSKDGNTSKRSSPLKDSIVFKDDLEKELNWQDETTILFSEEKIPIHKLFFQNFKPSTGPKSAETGFDIHDTNINDRFNSTDEYMDVSNNDTLIEERTLTELHPDNNKNEVSVLESDSEFVDCETYTKKESQLQGTNGTETSEVSPVLNTQNLNTTQDILLTKDINCDVNQLSDITFLSFMEGENKNDVTEPSDYSDYSKETTELLSELETFEKKDSSQEEFYKIDLQGVSKIKEAIEVPVKPPENDQSMIIPAKNIPDNKEKIDMKSNTLENYSTKIKSQEMILENQGIFEKRSYQENEILKTNPQDNIKVKTQENDLPTPTSHIADNVEIKLQSNTEVIMPNILSDEDKNKETVSQENKLSLTEEVEKTPVEGQIANVMELLETQNPVHNEICIESQTTKSLEVTQSTPNHDNTNVFKIVNDASTDATDQSPGQTIVENCFRQDLNNLETQSMGDAHMPQLLAEASNNDQTNILSSELIIDTQNNAMALKGTEVVHNPVDLTLPDDVCPEKNVEIVHVTSIFKEIVIAPETLNVPLAQNPSDVPLPDEDDIDKDSLTEEYPASLHKTTAVITPCEIQDETMNNLNVTKIAEEKMGIDSSPGVTTSFLVTVVSHAEVPEVANPETELNATTDTVIFNELSLQNSPEFKINQEITSPDLNVTKTFNEKPLEISTEYNINQKIVSPSLNTIKTCDEKPLVPSNDYKITQEVTSAVLNSTKTFNEKTSLSEFEIQQEIVSPDHNVTTTFNDKPLETSLGYETKQEVASPNLNITKTFDEKPLETTSGYEIAQKYLSVDLNVTETSNEKTSGITPDCEIKQDITLLDLNLTKTFDEKLLQALPQNIIQQELTLPDTSITKHQETGPVKTPSLTTITDSNLNAIPSIDNSSESVPINMSIDETYDDIATKTIDDINTDPSYPLNASITKDNLEQALNKDVGVEPMDITMNETFNQAQELPDIVNQTAVLNELLVTKATLDCDSDIEKSEINFETTLEEKEKKKENEKYSIDIATDAKFDSEVQQSDKSLDYRNQDILTPTVLAGDGSGDPDMKMRDRSIEALCADVETVHSVENTEVEPSALDEEFVVSGNISPYVSLLTGVEAVTEKVEETLEQNENTFVTNSNISSSPPITSKGYSFNFDEIEDPFATKTKIRLSPPLDTPTKAREPNNEKLQFEVPKKGPANRRKSQPPERKRPAALKKKFNTTIDMCSSSKPNKKVALKNNTSHTKMILEQYVEHIKIQDKETAESKTSFDETQTLRGDSNHEENNLSSNLSSESKNNMGSTKNSENPHEICDYNKTSIDSFDAVPNDLKNTSSSEQSTYYSAASSSTESVKAKNVFNLPEIDDINFNPFATKSKMRQSPPPGLDIENTFAARTKIEVSPDTSMIFTTKTNTKTSPKQLDIKVCIEDKTETELMEKETCNNISSCETSSSSKDTENQNLTAREVNTEDEDTIEGPFLEADDVSNMLDFDTDNVDMMQLNDVQDHGNDDNMEGEMFIDAEAFEFLLNQNKSNVVADSGKESLFLKFDPLFAKRVSTDGVLAALNNVQKRQSTPTKDARPSFRNDVSPIPGPSTLNVTFDGDNNITQDSNEDANITVSKPMMVVPPAVNAVVTPRNKSLTPNRSNRRSITFTSPAIAVIDRLLSMSANNSFIGHDNTITQANRESNEADIVLTQLRDLLAEKEISVCNLRSESKELKDRLNTMMSQVKVLETDGQERLKKIGELNERLAEKTKINKSMAAVVEEYERTIASLISEIEQDKKRNAEERIRLINERDEQVAHLASMEVSFSDLHSKYEKSKQVILECKSNEDTYKKSLNDFEQSLTKMQANYEMLKQHATSKLNHANQELEKMNRAHESEVVKLNAMIKRKDIHITSLEETLAQKTKANEELTAICDELINKVG